MTTPDDEDDDLDDLPPPALALPAAAPAAHTLVVEPRHEGERLDKFLAQLVPDTSRSLVQKHLALGAVSVDGQPPLRGAATALTVGSVVTYTPPAPERVTLEAEDTPLSILYQDADVVVVDKPAGLVVHPALGHWSGTLVNALMFHVPDFARQEGDLRPGIVHRLDRDTTGVMIVAKHERAHRVLVADFAARQVDKTYLAVTHGRPTPATGTIDTAYGRHPTDRKKFSSKVAHGKRAVTRYVVEATYPARPTPTGAALVRVQLETGRTHQIRVHLADRGHPLVGDATYGTRRTSHPREAALRAVTEPFARPALHAARLVIPQPMTRAPLVLEAPVPPDLAALIAALEALP